MSDLDRLLKQVEELKALAQRPDDTWMEKMSNDELRALGKRVRKVADGLTGLQGQLMRSVPRGTVKPTSRPVPPQRAASGSLGSMVRRDTVPTTPQGPPPPTSALRVNPFPGRASDADLSNPMQRRRGAIPREAPPAAPRPAEPWRKPGETPPPGRRGGRPSF